MLLKLFFFFVSLCLNAFEAESSRVNLPKSGVYLNSDGAPILKAIPAARHSIDLEIYTMSDPTIQSLLQDALARGVQIRVIMEPSPVGSTCKPFEEDHESTPDCIKQKKLISEIQNRGGEFVPFNKAALCPANSPRSNCLQHGKIALIDNLALISTGNLDSTNLCINNPMRCNRDFTVVEDNPHVVKTLQSLFEADLKGSRYNVKALIPGSLQKTLTVSPDSLAPVINFLNSAENSIEFETQYLKAQELNEALIAAAKRGVHVELTVSSFCAFGKPSSSQAQKIRETYRAFDRAGITTRVFNSSNLVNGKPGYMHAKALIIDGSHAWIGSQNGSDQSLNINREYGIVFDTQDWVNKVQKIVNTDHENEDSESWEESLRCFKDKNWAQSAGIDQDQSDDF